MKRSRLDKATIIFMIVASVALVGMLVAGLVIEFGECGR